jgi:hypothetical protein
MINPLAQIANTYNDYNFKQLSGNFGLDYKFSSAFVLVQYDSKQQTARVNHLHQYLTMEEVKF